MSADDRIAEIRARIVARLRAVATSEQITADRARAEARDSQAVRAEIRAEVLRDMADEIEREGQG